MNAADGCTIIPTAAVRTEESDRCAAHLQPADARRAICNADFVHQNVIPRTSHEGIQFDKAGNMYFIDELNGGNIYKFTSAATLGRQVRAG